MLVIFQTQIFHIMLINTNDPPFISTITSPTLYNMLASINMHPFNVAECDVLEKKGPIEFQGHGM